MEKQWRSLEEYRQGPLSEPNGGADPHKENVLGFLEGQETSPASRRDFLKLFGFSFASAALLSSCEKPVQKAIPYLIKPEEIIPGKASYYASTFFDGTEYASILVKVRDGRPIKIEGNPGSPESRGGTTARIQASVLNLYDESRYQAPILDGTEGTWEALDARVAERLAQGGSTVVLSSTVTGPASRAVILDFLRAHPSARWIQYDEVSFSGIRQAHQEIFGRALIPYCRFDRANFILSFGADFLGTWLAPVEFARDYASTRDLSDGRKEMSRHIQVESALTLTGTNADERIPATPDQSARMLGAIYEAIARATGQPGIHTGPSETDVSAWVAELLEHRGTSLVLSGSNDPNVQKMVAGINHMLGNYGATLDTDRPLQLKQGDDPALWELLGELNRGEVENLLVIEANPAYSLPEWMQEKAGFSVYLGSARCETGAKSQAIGAGHHYLESWGDAEFRTGSYSLQQPCIRPIFQTRSWQDSLLRWAGVETDFRTYLRTHWEDRIRPAGEAGDGSWWEATLQKGWIQRDVSPAELRFESPRVQLVPAAPGLVLCVVAPVALMDGRYANNPWLQELPDPVSKVCWDNCLALSPADGEALGIGDEDLVDLGGIRLPVLIQPGQAPGTMSVALGYGRRVAGKVGEGIGVNAFSWVGVQGGHRSYLREGLSPETTGKTHPLARTQTHHSMEERPIVREASLTAFRDDPHAGNEFHVEAESHMHSLYPETTFDGFHWGLVADLNKCTGCSNCVIACSSENNVAVVGKEEVRNRRIMHWMRIDRYYGGAPENPRVYHQPVMCQHCDNAPCENVCPVSATMHSNEGLNQVAYVRCIGTKYCINNCPYRVRRFNWFKYVKNDAFDYHMNSDLSRLVLNPDVTVRERGVVEKCTLCVQRIQEKKLEAKLEGRALQDGEIQPACVQSCPSGALVFGNLNDPESRVSRLKRQERNYHLLEQLHTLPSVGYLTRIRNAEIPGEAAAGHSPTVAPEKAMEQTKRSELCTIRISEGPWCWATKAWGKSPKTSPRRCTDAPACGGSPGWASVR
ncbi:MAG: Fe-S-cluster-containing hydrogenase [Bacteroidales bacterium]